MEAFEHLLLKKTAKDIRAKVKARIIGLKETELKTITDKLNSGIGPDKTVKVEDLFGLVDQGQKLLALEGELKWTGTQLRVLGAVVEEIVAVRETINILETLDRNLPPDTYPEEFALNLRDLVLLKF